MILEKKINIFKTEDTENFLSNMGTCCVPGCKSGSGKGIKRMRLFKFPRDPIMRKRWIRHLRYDKDWEPTPNATVCGLHFTEVISDSIVIFILFVKLLKH